MEEVLKRIVELVKEDKQLHDATVKCMLAWADLQMATAEHKRALAIKHGFKNMVLKWRTCLKS